MPSRVDGSIPSEGSVAWVDQLPITSIRLEAFKRPCCVKSAVSKSNGHFTYEIVFGGSCSLWEGRVRVPEGDTSVEIRLAWNKHVAQHRKGSEIEPMPFVVNPRNEFGCDSTIGNIVEEGQRVEGGAWWYRRTLQVQIEDTMYEGSVYTRRTDARTCAAIEVAKEKMALAFDDERDAAEAIRSIEEVPEKVEDKKTFDFVTYPQQGRGVEVTADNVHGYDLSKHRVAVTSVRKVGTRRDVRFRLLLPDDGEFWFQGTLEDDMKRGRFEQLEVGE
ncbi:hypothetical protein CBER1_00168 [Cercospora berteroae]|uniref:Uncharacterized protein n=1 Tax=Cercospora berteroae TaxID=357750 RepID=A0A2S6CD88_9PEZI|nr:hypothetical protein CBER1_00168 [Cercospora berteroae]